MKILHTSDWHLGQSFYGQDRSYEHEQFLRWLLTTIEQRRPDALLVAGDIFDVVNPSIKAQELLYELIVNAHRVAPAMTIVMIAGNHDSGQRIELPAPLMRRMNTHALGRVEWLDDGQLDAERLLIPLNDDTGKIAAWCLALPFLRPIEVTGGQRGNDYAAGIAQVHQQLITAAMTKRQPGQALVAMSHCHLHGATISADSERPIVIGGVESMSSAVFADNMAYVALGHLHKAQTVGGEHIRYCGSPLPMDFSEVNYHHQVLEITLQKGSLIQVEAIAIPRFLQLIRIGPAPLKKALAELKKLDDADVGQHDETEPNGKNKPWPWLEVRVQLDEPVVDLRNQIEAAIENKAVRLVRIHTEYPQAQSDSDSLPKLNLDELTPRQLFEHAWRAQYGDDIDDRVLHDFDHLLNTVNEMDPSS